jgi:hypothetical protein
MALVSPLRLSCMPLSRSCIPRRRWPRDNLWAPLPLGAFFKLATSARTHARPTIMPLCVSLGDGRAVGLRGGVGGMQSRPSSSSSLLLASEHLLCPRAARSHVPIHALPVASNSVAPPSPPKKPPCHEVARFGKACGVVVTVLCTSVMCGSGRALQFPTAPFDPHAHRACRSHTHTHTCTPRPPPIPSLFSPSLVRQDIQSSSHLCPTPW